MSLQQDSRRNRVMQRLQDQLKRGTKTVYVEGKPTQTEITDKDVKRINREIENIRKNLKIMAKPSEYKNTNI